MQFTLLGYVGYEESGTLTESVRRRPYQIILFDEFEKAHKEVANLLLQLLDEGHLTDSHGRHVDFRNCIIAMTSNVGAHYLANLDPGVASIKAKDKVMEELRSRFAPEFLNRIDETILFNRLTPENMNNIVDIQFKKIQAQMEERKVKLVMSPDAHKLLARVSYDPVYGARPLKRALQQYLLNPLSKMVLEGQCKEHDTILLLAPEEATAEECKQYALPEAKEFLVLRKAEKLESSNPVSDE